MTFNDDMSDFAAQVRPAWQLTSAQQSQAEILVNGRGESFTAEAQRTQLDHGLYWALVNSVETVVGTFFYPLDLPVSAHSPIAFTYVLPPVLNIDWNYRNLEAISILLAAVTAETNGWINPSRPVYFEPGDAGHLDSLRMMGMSISHAGNPRTLRRLWSLPYHAVPSLAAKTYAVMTYGAISGGLAGNAWIRLADEVAYAGVVRQIAGGQRFPSQHEDAVRQDSFKLKIADALQNLRPAS